MKTAGQAMRAFLGAACLLLLAGCYESPDVTVYEPGVYKGAKDPLLAQKEVADRQQVLKKRFSDGQMDR